MYFFTPQNLKTHINEQESGINKQKTMNKMILNPLGDSDSVQSV